MKTLVVASLCALTACEAAGGGGGEAPARVAGPLTAVPFDQVAITDAFWRPRIETNRAVTVKACLDKCEETGRIANFARCAGLEPGGHEGALFNDSDVYKVLEGAAYSLETAPDAALEARCDAIIDKVAAAQQPDGYLNTYWTMVEPAKRWTDIRHGHELYCAGHLIEGAIAYKHATGKRKLLDVALRFADCIDKTFGPGKKLDPPGHPELELALVKLWRETGEPRYLALAQFFVDQRGNSNGRELFGDYAQDHRPIREQRAIVGHAVRAMYLYCALADVAGVTGDAQLWEALDALWSDVVETKMYVTGGIGSSAANEGFTEPFDLPNETAYCETCAAIGMALWNQRMFLATGESKYADVVERELYNGFLSGVSLSGDLFFYGNPLASRGGYGRVPWFDCSCCPSNVVRVLPSIGERIYAQRGDELYVSLFVASEATVKLASGSVRIRQETNYPWDGEVAVHVEPEVPFEFDLLLRIPDWARDEERTELMNSPVPFRIDYDDPGFVRVHRLWSKGDEFTLRLTMKPRRVYADARVAADRGRVAVMRGPLVYCAEGVDNGGAALNLVLPRDAQLSDVAGAASPSQPLRIAAVGERVTSRHFDTVVSEKGAALQLVPYYFWANRGAGEMCVWLPESAALAEAPGQSGELVGDTWVSASHVFANDTLAAVCDGKLPKSSADHDLPRQTFWNHRGTNEWLQYEWREPRSLSKASVYWFDDTGRGSCRVPKSWRLAYRDGGAWKPVELAPGASYGCGKDAPQSVAFSPLTSDALRLEVELQPAVSAGILEWRVE